MNSTRWPPGVRTNARAAPHGRRCSSGVKPASRRRSNAACQSSATTATCPPCGTTGSSVNRKWICVPTRCTQTAISLIGGGGSTRSKPSSAQNASSASAASSRSPTETCCRVIRGPGYRGEHDAERTIEHFAGARVAVAAPHALTFAPMATEQQADLLWEPSEERIERATMTRYLRWLEAEKGLRFDGY